VGTTLGVALQRQPGAGHSIFLFGRVVRHQEGHRRGVGVAWDKAVTLGPPDHLAAFLEKLLGISDAIVGQETGRRGETRAVYEFAHAATLAPTPLDPVAVPPVSAVDPTRKSGRLTTLIEKRSVRVDANLPGTLTCQGATVKVVVTAIGLAGLTVKTPLVPRDRAIPLELRVEVRSGQRMLGMDFKCRLAHASKDTVELDVQSLREDVPGLLKEVVKRLQFRSLAGMGQ
jgi:hypothetical protein